MVWTSSHADLGPADYLAEVGIEYIGGWVLDGEPMAVRATTSPVVALPHSLELHDIVMKALQHHESAMFRVVWDGVRILDWYLKERFLA